MNTSLSSITDFFNCFNLPIAILDNNFSMIYSRCYGRKEKNLFNELNIVEDLKKLNFKPSSVQLSYKDDLSITTILFYDNKKPMFLIIGPYKLTNSDANFVTNPECLYHLTSLITNILNINSTNITSPIVSRAIDYIEENYADSITMDDICSEFNINKCYFCCVFKNKTGTTFVNYLNNYRVEKSKELLQNSSLSLLDISVAVGFNNQSYYSTIFKKFVDMTPLEYRYNFSK